MCQNVIIFGGPIVILKQASGGVGLLSALRAGYRW